jgi:catechol 2,3-dioxygenase-like lactoylglutathione lyase family enzyme
MSEETYPTILQTVLDCADPRATAEFYRQMFGLRYRPGDEVPPDGQPDENGQDWLVLLRPDGGRSLAFGKADDLAETTWPEPGVPQQMHLDTSVESVEELERQHDRAVALGARLRFDRTDDPDEPLRVYADPAGHLFCIFVAG